MLSRTSRRVAAVAAAGVVTILAGVVAAIITTSASSSTTGGSVAGTAPVLDTSVVPVDPTRVGTGCLGGLCVDALPDEILLDDVAAYLAVLAEGLAADGTAAGASACHDLAHEIGRRAAGGGDVTALLNLDDGRCLYGYQHGVLEGWSAGVDIDTLRAGLPRACDAYLADRTAGGLGAAEMAYAGGSCAHGVGHAIALQGVGRLAAALAYCDLLAAHQHNGCAGGVFMAYASETASYGAYAPKRPLELERDEVMQLCPTLRGAYQTECWSKLWLLGTRVSMRAADIAALCPIDGDGSTSCARGVGEAMLYEASFDVDAALASCPVAIETDCTTGVAWANANAHVGAGGSREEYTSICPPGGTACRAAEQQGLDGAVPH